MEMLVDIHVIESEAGAREGGELRADFRLQLPAGGGFEKKSHASAKHVAVHASVGGGDFGDQLRIERRPAIGEHDVQSDAQVGQIARTSNGVVGGGRRHHETGRIQGLRAVRLLDGLVDRFVKAEIIGRYDQVFRSLSEHSA